ncbi:MAG: hypothetical protein QM647_15045 [Asticcacaulis sp.]|uniref:hypothetical protein n=1 Tax=Asticcacaulis sp. TaxID=1872648 RepID=UPI0039E262D6
MASAAIAAIKIVKAAWTIYKGWAATHAIAASVAKLVVTTAASSLISKALTSKTKGLGSSGSQTSFSADTDAGIPFVLGRSGVGGDCVFKYPFGPNNKHLIFFVALSAASTPTGVQAIEAFTANKTTVPFTASTGAVSDTSNDFHSRMWMKTQLGLGPSPVIPQPTEPATDSSWTSIWTSAHKLSGYCAAAWDIEYDTDVYSSGEPTPIWVVQGIKCYDPRLDDTYSGGSGPQRIADRSTWTYTENPYLHGLTYLLGYEQNGVRIGGVGMAASEIDIASYVEAANVADANGWKVGGRITSTDSKWECLKAILKAGSGEPLKIGGMVSCRVDTPRTSLATLQADDLAGEINIMAVKTRRERKNSIIPRYRSEADNWIYVSGSAVSVSEYIALDGGLRQQETEYTLCQDSTQAGQLAAYDLVNAREFGPVQIACKPAWMGYKPGDCITLNLPDMGLNNQKALITARDIDLTTGAVSLTFQTETDGKHEFALGSSSIPPETPGLSVPNFLSTPAPESGQWSAALGTDTAGIPSIVVTGSASDYAFCQDIVVEYRVTGATAWTMFSASPRTATSITISGLGGSTAYQVAVSYKSIYGVTGTRLVLDALTTGASTVDTIPAESITGQITGDQIADGVIADAIADTIADVQAQIDEAQAEASDALEAATTAEADAQTAIAAAAQEAADRAAEVSALSASLQAQLDSVAAQVAELNDTAEYDSATAYEDGDIVKFDGGLYKAIQDVPAGHDPTETDYWTKIGDYASLGDAVIALAAQVSDLDSEVTELDGELTAEITSRETLAAQLRGTYTGTDPSALSQGLVYNEKQARVSGDAANASSITALSSTVTALQGTVSGNSTAITALQTTVTNQGTSITANSNAITSLTSTVAGKADASAVTALTTRVTAAENSITSLSSSVTNLSSSLADSGSQNLAYNPSFDVGSGTVADGWASSATGLTATFTISSGTSYDSNAGKSQYITSTGFTTTAYADIRSGAAYYPAVTAGVTYTWSAYVLATATVQHRLYIQFRNSSGTVLSTPTSALTAATGDWLRMSISGTAPSGAVEAILYLRTYGLTTTAATASVYWDRAQFEQGSSATGWRDNKLADAAALTALTTRVTTAEGTLTTLSTSVTSLTSTVAGKADTSALTALTTRVTAAENSITSLSTSVTSLQSNLASSGGQNLLYNPGFDTGSSPTATGWSAQTSSGVTQTTTLISSVTYDPGGLAQRLSGTGLSDSLYMGLYVPSSTYWPTVVAGKTYTYSIYAAAGGGLRGQIIIQWLQSDGSTVISTVSLAQTTVTAAWMRLTLTVTAPTDAVYARCYARYYGSSSVSSGVGYFDCAQFEEGSVATAWRDNPKVNAAAITALTTRVTTAEGTITSLSSSLTSLSSTVAGKADTSALTALTTRVTAAENSITSLSTSVTSLTSTLSDAGSENLLYNPSFDAGTGTVADGWTSSVSSGVTATCAIVASDLDADGKSQRVVVDGVSSSLVADLVTYPSAAYYAAITPSSNHTGSVWYKATSGLRIYLILSFGTVSGDTFTTVQNFSGTAVVTTGSGTWQRLSLTALAPSGATHCRLYCRTLGGSTATSGTVYWDRAQLEKGDTATGWRDNSQANAAALTALTTRVTTAEGTLTTLSTSVTTLSSTVSGKADASAVTALTTRVTSAEGTITSLSSSVSSLSTTVGSHTSTITTLTSTQTTQSGQITSLLSRWSVLVDNDGNISGIVLNSSGATSNLNLLASKVTIGDGTTSVQPFTVSGGIVQMTNVMVSGTIGVNSAASFVDPTQPTLALRSRALASSSWDTTDFSTLSNTYQPVSGSNGSWITIAGNCLFRNNSSTTDIKNRVRTGSVSFRVDAYGSVDYDLSIWYRMNGTGGYTFLAHATDNSSAYGNVSVGWVGDITIAAGDYIQFYLGICDSSGNIFNTGNRQFVNAKIIVEATNF